MTLYLRLSKQWDRQETERAGRLSLDQTYTPADERRANTLLLMNGGKQGNGELTPLTARLDLPVNPDLLLDYFCTVPALILSFFVA